MDEKDKKIQEYKDILERKEVTIELQRKVIDTLIENLKQYFEIIKSQSTNIWMKK